MERHIIVDDFGRAMNPTLLEGQVQGRLGAGDSQLSSGSFMATRFRARATCRHCDFHHVPCTTNPLGVKGDGEAGAGGGKRGGECAWSAACRHAAHAGKALAPSRVSYSSTSTSAPPSRERRVTATLGS
jgi:hypothetical protein